MPPERAQYDKLSREITGRVGAITVAERPVRVLITAAAVLSSATAAAAVLAGLSLIALLQLGWTLRREEIVA